MRDLRKASAWALDQAAKLCGGYPGQLFWQDTSGVVLDEAIPP